MPPVADYGVRAAGWCLSVRPVFFLAAATLVACDAPCFSVEDVTVVDETGSASVAALSAARTAVEQMADWTGSGESCAREIVLEDTVSGAEEDLHGRYVARTRSVHVRADLPTAHLGRVVRHELCHALDAAAYEPRSEVFADALRRDADWLIDQGIRDDDTALAEAFAIWCEGGPRPTTLGWMVDADAVDPNAAAFSPTPHVETVLGDYLFPGEELQLPGRVPLTAHTRSVRGLSLPLEALGHDLTLGATLDHLVAFGLPQAAHGSTQVLYAVDPWRGALARTDAILRDPSAPLALPTAIQGQAWLAWTHSWTGDAWVPDQAPPGLATLGLRHVVPSSGPEAWFVDGVDWEAGSVVVGRVHAEQGVVASWSLPALPEGQEVGQAAIQVVEEPGGGAWVVADVRPLRGPERWLSLHFLPSPAPDAPAIAIDLPDNLRALGALASAYAHNPSRAVALPDGRLFAPVTVEVMPGSEVSAGLAVDPETGAVDLVSGAGGAPWLRGYLARFDDTVVSAWIDPVEEYAGDPVPLELTTLSVGR